MSIINCYYVTDVIPLFKLVTTRDIRVLNVKHLQIPKTLSQQ